MLNKLIVVCRKFLWSNEKYARFLGVKIGDNCDIQDVRFGSEPYLVEIGDHVQITSGTKIFTHGAAWVLREKYPKIDFFGKVKIGNNVYIGNNTLIMPGVMVGNNVIIAAGSVITKSICDNSIVGGNPAKVIGNFFDFEEKMKKFDINTKGLSYKEKKEVILGLDNEFFISK